MLTFYCPQCWTSIPENQQTCPSCGFVLNDFAQFDFEEKLISALSHSIPERRIMAAQILGNRKCTRALPKFSKIILSNESNYFFLRAVLLAIAKIDQPERNTILQTATHHSSQLVSQLAKDLIDQIESGQSQDIWDQNTG